MIKTEFVINGHPIKGAKRGNNESILHVAITITNKAKALAPTDTGQLRNSIMYKTYLQEGGLDDGSLQHSKKNPKKIGERNKPISEVPKDGEGFVGTSLLHGIYQEFGTRKMAPQPYLRPAIALAQGENEKSIIKKIMKEQMLGALKEGQKRTQFIKK